MSRRNRARFSIRTSVLVGSSVDFGLRNCSSKYPAHRNMAWASRIAWSGPVILSINVSQLNILPSAEPDIVEDAKWRKASNPDGVPTFSLDGLICTLETYKDKIKLTSAKGASLPDPAKLFNASLGAGVRYLYKRSGALDEGTFVALVQAVAALNRG